MLQWAREVRDQADFFVLVDESDAQGRTTSARIRAAAAKRGLGSDAFRLNSFTSQQVAAKYPASTHYPRQGRVAAFTGTEWVSYWWHQQPDPSAYRFAWFLEDDVGISGSAGELLQAYAENATDALMGTKLWLTDDPGFQWVWTSSITKAYAERVRHHQRYHCQVQVMRWSWNLLQEVDRWLQADADAYIEEFPLTVAASSSLTHSLFREEHIGSVWEVGTAVSKKQWDRILALREKPPRIYHALKF